ncbi:hypothetical protein [Cupriavidus pauculus]|uniref:hypothetical protein n=1 Tax=Cupriavidus pauculus TaxID=82633 RepID=UPI001EE2DA89|nr:hypothetical protein [Cupriavidus pauculus]GJG93727.1 hypothetical protein CBA19C6_04580 [Cupriavidus pauculus]
MQIVDNRAATKVPHDSKYPDNYFGLGSVDAANIGSYALVMKNGSADGRTAAPLGSKNAGASWTRMSGDYYTGTEATYAWSTDASATPGTIERLEQPLSVKTWIVSKPNLPIQGDISLDGSLTLSVVYL